MIRRILALTALTLCTGWSGVWQEGSIIGVPVENPSRPRTIYVESVSSWRVPWVPQYMSTWITIDLADGPQWTTQTAPIETNTPNLPADIKAVMIRLILIVTNGSGSAYCDLQVKFRAFNTAAPDIIAAQTVADPVKGARTNAFLIVPVINRKFDFWYWSNLPAGCSVAVNGVIQGYVR